MRKFLLNTHNSYIAQADMSKEIHFFINKQTALQKKYFVVKVIKSFS